jgi:hypothetical protein
VQVLRGFGTMPRYYFDVQDGNTWHVDEVGEVLDGPEAAFSEAMGLLSELAHQGPPDARERALTSIVRDADGNRLYKATLSLSGMRLP